MRQTLHRAFTLVEILIVVVILGILASVIVPQFGNTTDEASRAAFIRDLRVFSDAAALYTANELRYLEDSSSGVVPDGFDRYVNTTIWTRRTPIGGQWDAEYAEMGITSAIGVHFRAGFGVQDDAYMNQIDAVIDDGDVSTGMFRRLGAGRYYAVLAE